MLDEFLRDSRRADAPISDYGAIGNLRTVALVGLDGSIDWWCPPVLSNPSVFGALLDRHKAGRFRISPRHVRRREQRYVDETNVLETSFEAEGGRLTVTDFMPLIGDLSVRAPRRRPGPRSSGS
jgi:GH15 family glucan-1,4-alpha-glucosidase